MTRRRQERLQGIQNQVLKVERAKEKDNKPAGMLYVNVGSLNAFGFLWTVAYIVTCLIVHNPIDWPLAVSSLATTLGATLVLDLHEL